MILFYYVWIGLGFFLGTSLLMFCYHEGVLEEDRETMTNFQYKAAVGLFVLIVLFVAVILGPVCLLVEGRKP